MFKNTYMIYKICDMIVYTLQNSVLSFQSIYYILWLQNDSQFKRFWSISIQVEPSRFYLYTLEWVIFLCWIRGCHSMTWGLRERWKADRLTRFWPQLSFLYSALVAMTMYYMPSSCSMRLWQHERLGEFHCHNNIKTMKIKG